MLTNELLIVEGSPAALIVNPCYTVVCTASKIYIYMETQSLLFAVH